MKLHVISFDVPWPANYGGVIDIYNRLEALHQNGFEVILHAFDYGRGQSEELLKICSEVNYYKRKNRALGLLRKDPMIISTRYSKELLQRLQKDDYPILFEGQHTTSFLDHPSLEGRKKLVRLHNVEHEYYSALNQETTNPGKSVYFKREAEKLRKHEDTLKNADHLLCITQKDADYYQDKFGNASYLPVAIQCKAERNPSNSLSPFILYHGNLSVSENVNAAKWLLENICLTIDHDFIFAGKDPSTELVKRVEKFSNVTLIENPSQELMLKLIDSTIAHVFHTNQATGIKIKLLNSLCSGAPIFCNETMVEGTGLKDACIVNDEPEQYVKSLNQFLVEGKLISDVDRKKRLESYSYSAHADKLLSFLQ
jgi:hypothetical protein